MSVVTNIRRGQGPLWGSLKRLAKFALTLHMPVNGLTRPVWKLLYHCHVLIRELWVWFRRFFWNEPLFRSQCQSVGDGLQIEELPYIQGRGGIVLGDHVQLSGKSEFTFNNRHLDLPKLAIGSGTFLGHGCSIRVASSVEIGQHVLIAGDAIIADYDGHPLDANLRRGNETSPWSDVKPVVIEDDVWLGANVTVLKGVRIGARSIVAAQSVVTKDVPADCIVAGNPARFIRSLVLNVASQEHAATNGS